jgi:hypothetical protein
MRRKAATWMLPRRMQDDRDELELSVVDSRAFGNGTFALYIYGEMRASIG